MMSSNDNPCVNPNKTLGIDEACFNILNFYNDPVYFYSIPYQAYWGLGKLQAILQPSSNTSLVVSTREPLHFYYGVNETLMSCYLEYCHSTYNFYEYGSYGWNISAGDLCSSVYVIKDSTVKYYEAFILTLFAFMSYVLIWILCKGYVRWMKKSSDNVLEISDLDGITETESMRNPVIRTTKSSTRIRSVDTFRGIAILLMIFVNNGGGRYVWFNHSPWYGLTIADLVLPWFAWIMGVTITIAKRAEFRVTTSRIKIITRCFQRSLILILLGLMLNSMKLVHHKEPLSNLRFPGVLQLMAVTYFVCATLETIFMKSYSQDVLLQFGRFAWLRDVLDSWPQWLIIIGITTTHTLISFLLPVPNCPIRGYFGPGGEFDHRGKYMNCTAGAAGHIDRTVFGSHMYANTESSTYGTLLPYDPEGLMNTISAILIVYLGVHAGKILLLYYQCNSRVIRWCLWAVITGLIAGCLCNFERQGGVIPVSKRVMSLSFVLTCCCFAFLLFAILYLTIDYRQIWSGAPFIYAGQNPIFLYVGHMITSGLFPWEWNIAHPTHISLSMMNLWTTTLWGEIAYLLYRKNIIITV